MPAQRSAVLGDLPPDGQLLRSGLEAALAELPQSQAAEEAYRAGDGPRCREGLAMADAALRQAGQGNASLRAHRWIDHSLCQRDQTEAAASRLAALQRADALFDRHRPGQ